MKTINELKQIAKQVYQLELELQQNSKVKNVQELQSKIENIIYTLQLDQFFIIDEIIQEKNFDF